MIHHSDQLDKWNNSSPIYFEILVPNFYFYFLIMVTSAKMFLCNYITLKTILDSLIQQDSEKYLAQEVICCIWKEMKLISSLECFLYSRIFHSSSTRGAYSCVAAGKNASKTPVAMTSSSQSEKCFKHGFNESMQWLVSADSTTPIGNSSFEDGDQRFQIVPSYEGSY